MIDVTELPITPKRWLVTGQNTRSEARRNTQFLAAIMPYPSLTGHEPCAGDTTYTTDWERISPIERTLAEREMRDKCQACPVLVACREWAIAHDKYNFAGGMTAQDREAERINRGQAYVEPHNAAIWNLDLSHFYVPPTTCSRGHEISTNTHNVVVTDVGRAMPSCTVCYDMDRAASSARRKAANRKAS